MDKQIKILILDDNPADAELMKRELRRAGLDFMAESAQDKGTFLNILDKFIPDIILADYSLPGFDGLSALNLSEERFADVPVIIVSGAIGEEGAIEVLKAGATDYVLKNRLNRLVPVVVRALNEAKILSEHKKAEEIMRASLMRYKTYIDVTGQIGWVTNAEGDAVEDVLSWRKYTGQSYEELKGRGWLKAIHPDDVAQVVLAWKKSVATKSAHEVECRIRRHDGVYRHFLNRGNPVFKEDGTIKEWIGASIDITEIKEAQEVLRRDKEALEKLIRERTQELFDARQEMERARRLSDIGALAATVAHELRNPLAAIGMATHNIKRKANLSDIEKHINNIEKKISESDQIISNLLFYSRIKPPRSENVDIADILEECMEAAGKQLNKKVFMMGNLDPVKGISIEADTIQIREVFSNILSNAVDAVAYEGGNVQVLAEDEDGFIKVAIKDNGHGIDKNVIDKIFDPFFTTKARGTGLGLSVCRQIIDMHTGKIEVDSEPGKGTRVVVSLPKKERKKE